MTSPNIVGALNQLGDDALVAGFDTRDNAIEALNFKNPYCDPGSNSLFAILSDFGRVPALSLSINRSTRAACTR